MFQFWPTSPDKRNYICFVSSGINRRSNLSVLTTIIIPRYTLPSNLSEKLTSVIIGHPPFLSGECPHNILRTK